MTDRTQSTRDLCEAVTREAIDPALALLPARMDSPEARVMLLAIGLQESRLTHRRQLVGTPPRPVGPAAGLWQFERGSQSAGGGVWGVMLHPASRVWLHDLCAARSVPFQAQAIWQAIQKDDILAAGLARLLLFTDGKRLPDVADVSGAWALYANRTWRPGKPHRATWDAFHRLAADFVKSAAAAA